MPDATLAGTSGWMFLPRVCCPADLPACTKAAGDHRRTSYTRQRDSPLRMPDFPDDWWPEDAHHLRIMTEPCILTAQLL
ncbi:hypothetical protein WJX84_003260 [Apatococcus fuscideae]|uniref:Uncharacterized protein n=1 Tax=Apatococcus fuscideae TaxID=2026836 RepID=A0AAW1ST36_9CHLO